MTRTLARSVTLAVPMLLCLSACGGSGPSEAPRTATTVAPAPAAPAAPPAAGAPPTTVPGEEATPLLAWAEAQPESGKAPLTVEFKADVEGGTAPLKYKWTFGDGSPDSSETNPKHTYEKAGQYRADLSVADSAGDSDSDYVEIEVQ
jgi:PKD repeat protein